MINILYIVEDLKCIIFIVWYSIIYCFRPYKQFYSKRPWWKIVTSKIMRVKNIKETGVYNSYWNVMQ